MTAWMTRASCAQISGDLWYADEGQPSHRKAAIETCRKCPVRTQCLAHAMELEAKDERTSIRYGIFGGLTPQQRIKLAQQGRR